MSNHFKTYFAPYFDSLQLITKNLDGGDTCSRHFTALYCTPHTPEELHNALNLLQKDGIPIRHPDASKWYSRTNTTSRDQLIPYLCFVSTPNSTAYDAVRSSFLKLAAQHAKRLFLLTWNSKHNFRYPTPEEHVAKSTPDVPYDYSSKLPDICGPNIWSIYIRAAMQYFGWLWPLLPFLYILLHILDIYELLDALKTAFWHYIVKHEFGPTSNPANIDHDCQNSTLVIHYCAKNVPTIISLLSWAIYKKLGMKASYSFFTQPGEPPLHLVLNTLD